MGVAAAAMAGPGMAGSVMDATGTYASDKYQAQVAKNNQTLANYNSQVAWQSGVDKVEALDQKTTSMIGQARANSGASGIDPNSGSSVRVQASTADIGSINSQTTEENARRQAYNYRLQANAFGDEASMKSKMAPLDAFSFLVSGATSVGSKWANFQMARGGGIGGGNAGSSGP